MALGALMIGCGPSPVRDASVLDATADDAALDASARDRASADSPAARDTAAPDAPVAACTTPASPATIAPLDCMATGLVPRDTAGALPPSLPFYQPAVDASSIDAVVPSPPGFPTSNHFTVLEGWDGAQPLVPIVSWDLGIGVNHRRPGKQQ